MSFTAAAIAAGALGAAGGLLDTGINAWSADHLQNKSFEENERARDWEEYMASNKYQMLVSDLQKAGLNPALALGGVAPGVSGASSPGGQTGAFSGASIGKDIISLVNTAINGYLQDSLQDKRNSLQLANRIKSLATYDVNSANWVRTNYRYMDE